MGDGGAERDLHHRRQNIKYFNNLWKRDPSLWSEKCSHADAFSKGSRRHGDRIRQMDGGWLRQQGSSSTKRQRGAKQGVSSLFAPAAVQKAAERLRKRINTPEWGRAEFAGLAACRT